MQQQLAVFLESTIESTKGNAQVRLASALSNNGPDNGAARLREPSPWASPAENSHCLWWIRKRNRTKKESFAAAGLERQCKVDNPTACAALLLRLLHYRKGHTICYVKYSADWGSAGLEWGHACPDHYPGKQKFQSKILCHVLCICELHGWIQNLCLVDLNCKFCTTVLAMECKAFVMLHLIDTWKSYS